MNKKRIMLSILIAVICLGLVGVTYAAFTYSRVGTTNSKQIVGDIYMHYRESNVLTLENAMPSNTYDSTKYFEFTIDGKNTYTKKDIYYEIDLTHGDNPNIEGRTIRLNDKFLKFRLVEVVGNEENEIFTNKSYNDLTNKRIHVETIPKNTTNEITKTYRIYMWIDNNLRIGNDNADYSTEDWNKIYASIKVNVRGDFEEKYTTTPPSCFTTSDNGDNTVTITRLVKDTYELNSNMTNEELQSCITYYNSKGFPGNGTDFCQGTGTMYGRFGGPTFQEALDSNRIYSSDIQYYLENNVIILTSEAPIECQNLIEISIPRVLDGKIVTTIGMNAFSNNQLISVEIPNSVTIIEQEAFWGNQLTSVEIPDSVATIGDGAFYENKLTSVSIPDSVTTIGEHAFAWNQLASVEIPNSVTTIGSFAFESNQLTSIVIPENINSIGQHSFAGNLLTYIEINASRLNFPNVGVFEANGKENLEKTVKVNCASIANYALMSLNIVDLELGENLTTIGDCAFQNNKLTSVKIPDSVTTIGTAAFSQNQLTSVIIGNGITSIGPIAFSIDNRSNSNLNLSSITINKSCNDIKNNLLYNATNYYPWLSGTSPYTASGVTIYGSNNEVCDAF